MDIANSVKCITGLCKAVKIVKCVKKVEICLILSVAVIVGISTVKDNKKEIEKFFKQIKKKVG